MANINGTDSPETLDGTEDADTIRGRGGADTLNGLGGNDILDGGTGLDTMSGGLGDDIYYVDDAGDSVTEAAGAGSDTVITNASYTLGAGQEIELLRTYGSASTAAINLTGNEIANILQGNAAANVLDGKGGADLMRGYGGDDIYYVDNAGDNVVEAAGGGSDTVITNVSYTLGAHQEIELLRTYGSASTAAINLTGNEIANILQGNAAANVLDGKSGADSLQGFGGDDIYYVDNVGDKVIEAAGSGSDTIITNVAYTLGAGQEVELLRTYGSATLDAIDLTGNELANTIQGNAAANVLDGKGGADLLRGYGGGDTYYVDNAGDKVVEAAGGGSDTVIATVSYTVGAGQEIELLRTFDPASTVAINLTGNEFANTIYGNDGANVLNGKGGADSLQGFGGNDTYYVDNVGDSVIEAAGGGSDTILATVSYTLAAGQEVEVLRTLGSQTFDLINLTGNEFANRIEGNDNANVLDGKGGADIMAGYGGDDTYYVDNANDRVIDARGGSSTVVTSVSYTLDEITCLDLLRTYDPASTDAIDLTGNLFANTIEGNAGPNVIDGGGAVDVLWGYGGEDTFVSHTQYNRDWIEDFSSADDTIVLDGFFDGLPPGPLADGAFRIGTGGFDPDVRIVYDDTTGEVWFYPNGVGGYPPFNIFVLTGAPTLTAEDFLVI